MSYDITFCTTENVQKQIVCVITRMHLTTNYYLGFM